MSPLRRRHVLFDLDGTLVDTRNAVVECYRRVFRAALDRDFPPPEVPRAELFAMRPPEVFARVAPPAQIEALHAAYRRIYRDCTAFVHVFDGARDLIEDLVAAGRQPSLVTNKGLERALIDLEIAGIDPARFGAIVTAEDTADRKPHPAPILACLARLGITAEDAVYVGDGPQDVTAARAAGMPAIALTYGFYDRSALDPLQPDRIVASVAELAEVLGVARATEAVR